MTDLPQYAVPVTLDGVMWCVTPICVTPIGEAHPYRRVKVWKLSESIAFWVVWDDYEDAAILHPDLLAGLGREVPPIPKPKTRATAEHVEATGTAARQRDRILAYLRSRPDGATAAEVEAATGISGTRARLLELSHGIGRGPTAQCGLGLIERTEAMRIVPGHRAAFIVRWRAR